MLKEYVKAEVNLLEEEEVDLLNTNILLETYPDDKGVVNTIIRTMPFYNTGFINKDLVEAQDGTVANMILAPDTKYDANNISDYDDNTKLNKARVFKYYAEVSPELLERTPKFSIKESFMLERNGIEIMHNVIRRVTEVQALDAERVPLMNAVGEAVVDALNAVQKYKDLGGGDGVLPEPMTKYLSTGDIQAVSDAIAAFSDKDEEMRTVLDELASEVKIFINNTED